MTSKTQRVAILAALLLFVAASLSSTGYVFWQMYQDSKTKDATPSAQEQAATNQTQEDEMGDRKLEGFTPVSEVSELQKIDLKPGDGAEVKAGDTVTAHYTGALAKDGTIFESSKDSGEPATFPLDGLIEGWKEGIPGMKVGGTRRLIIPAAKAYGEAGSPPKIGPNEPLVFDIELVKIGE